MSRDPFTVFPHEITEQILMEVYLDRVPKEIKKVLRRRKYANFEYIKGTFCETEIVNKWHLLGSARLVCKAWDAHIQNIPYLWRHVGMSTSDSVMIEKLMNRATRICRNLTLTIPRFRNAYETLLQMPSDQVARIDSVVMRAHPPSFDPTPQCDLPDDWSKRRRADGHDGKSHFLFEQLYAALKLNSMNKLHAFRSHNYLKLDDLFSVLEECTDLTHFSFGLSYIPRKPQYCFPATLKSVSIFCRDPTDTITRSRDAEKWIFQEGLETLNIKVDRLWVNLSLPSSLRILHLEVTHPTAGTLSPDCARLDKLTKLSYYNRLRCTDTFRVERLVAQGMTNLTELVVENADHLLYVCRHNPGIRRISSGVCGFRESKVKMLIKYCPKLEFFEVRLDWLNMDRFSKSLGVFEPLKDILHFVHIDTWQEQHAF